LKNAKTNNPFLELFPQDFLKNYFSAGKAMTPYPFPLEFPVEEYCESDYSYSPT